MAAKSRTIEAASTISGSSKGTTTSASQKGCARKRWRWKASAAAVPAAVAIAVVARAITTLLRSAASTRWSLRATAYQSSVNPFQASRTDPEGLAGPAVEESLRYEPVTPFTARIVTEPIEYRDVTFPPGTIVMVSAWHGNRGGEADPDAFDISAERSGRILTFGAGIHYCVGANLARAELQEALAFLARNVERVELDGEPEFGTITGIYGLDRLPLHFG